MAAPEEATPTPTPTSAASAPPESEPPAGGDSSGPAAAALKPTGHTTSAPAGPAAEQSRPAPSAPASSGPGDTPGGPPGAPGRGPQRAADDRTAGGQWSEVLAALAQRPRRRDAEGGPVWGRLQPVRNALCAAAVLLVPLGRHTAAGWVASTASSYQPADLVLAAGVVLTVTGALLVGRLIPGLVGLLCSTAWSLLRALAARGRRLWHSRHGWVITRPAIWAVAGGGLILAWRPLTRILTGA
jgi:hypothetical protein